MTAPLRLAGPDGQEEERREKRADGNEQKTAGSRLGTESRADSKPPASLFNVLGSEGRIREGGVKKRGRREGRKNGERKKGRKVLAKNSLQRWMLFTALTCC